MLRNISALCLCLAAAIPAAAQFNGAIQTTNQDASQVNINQYTSKDLVYLTGGPQNANGKGLPDGIYFFQLTDPSGHTLLSTDPAHCRQVTVTGGKMTGWYDDSSGCVPHVNGKIGALNGETPVQAGITAGWFTDTPNNGGGYKMWVISQASGCNTTIVDADGKTADPNGLYLSFDGGCKKTDNFKVLASVCTVNCGTPTSIVSGVKYYDANTNGKFDTGEAVLGNWEIDVTYTYQGVPSNMEANFTNGGGTWSVVADQGTYLQACEVLQPGWLQDGPQNGAVSVPGGITAGSNCWTTDANGVPAFDTSGLDFGNYQQISGMKYFDLNRNGVNDGEAGIANFTIQFAFCAPVSPATTCVPSGVVTNTTVTGSGGSWSYVLPAPSVIYRACELVPMGWTQSGPANQGVNPQALNGCWNGSGGTTGLDFGNYISIAGRKTYDPSGAGISGWTINFSCSGGTGSCPASTTTDANGNYVIYPTGPIVSYTVCEGNSAGYTETSPTALTVPVNGATVKTDCASPNTAGWAAALGTATGSGLNFANTIKLAGEKFYDLNLDGVLDGSPTESGIQSFKINITYCTTGLTCTTLTGTTAQILTGVGGLFTWTAPVQITSYSVCEVLPLTGGWTEITTPACFSGVVGAASQTTLNFGNVCSNNVMPYSKGYWGSAPPGKAALAADYSAWALAINGLDANGVALTLVGGSKSYINPFMTNSSANAYSALSTLMGATATNMANMLSAQGATMELSTIVPVAGKTVNNNALMKLGTAAQLTAAGCTSAPNNLNSAGYAPLSDVFNYVNALLLVTPNTTSAGALRSCEAFVETALDNANNNQTLTIIQPTACKVVYP